MVLMGESIKLHRFIRYLITVLDGPYDMINMNICDACIGRNVKILKINQGEKRCNAQKHKRRYKNCSSGYKNS